MIVEWTKENANVIPCIAENGVEVGTLTLLPGSNEVDDELWKHARRHCKDDIDRGIIKEKFAKVDEEVVEDPETKEKKTTVKITSKSFKQLPIDDAIEVVNNTYSLSTLKKWEKGESRDSVRVEIKNRIDLIEKYGEDKKSKLKAKENDK